MQDKVVPKPNKFNLNSFPLIFIALALVIALFLIIKEKPWDKPKNAKSVSIAQYLTPTINPNAQDFTKWDVYTDIEGFEFGYPLVNMDCPTSFNTSKLEIPSRNIDLLEVLCNEGNTYAQVISETSSRDLWNWWYSLLPENKSFFEENGISQELNFAGEDAIQVSYEKDKENEHYGQVETFFHKHGKNYLLVLPHLVCPDNSCPTTEIEYQIFSTFRFSDENKE